MKPALQVGQLQDDRHSGDESLRALRDEIRAGDEETRRLMLVFHQEVLAQLAALDEKWSARTSNGRG